MWKPTRPGVNAIPNIINDLETGKPVLLFIAIQRDDTEEWALPGGMVDPGECITESLQREFGEEAMNTDKYPERAELIKKMLSNGQLIYQGYVDDPRNTDNAWMETQGIYTVLRKKSESTLSAVNFHVDQEDLEKLESGSDAKAVQWQRLDSKLKLYASHEKFVEMTAKHHNAHW